MEMGYHDHHKTEKRCTEKKTNNGTKDRNRITFTEWIFRKLVKCSERYAENRFRFVSYSKMCLLNMYNTF